MNFCRRCGTRLTRVSDHVYTCETRHTIYANSAPAVGVFFLSTDNEQILLARRGIEPNKGMLDSVGGFLDAHETFEEAAERELREELGLAPADYEPLTYVTSSYDEYPYKGESVAFTSVFFRSKLHIDASPQAADDVASVEWQNLQDINLSDIHSDDVRVGIGRLQKLLKEDS